MTNRVHSGFGSREAANSDLPFDLNADANRYLRLGWFIVLVFFGGFVLWASLAPLDKGVPMSGTVTVETNKKAVQHETGGTVQDVLVKDGDKVKAGDVLVRMNGVQVSADAETTRIQYLTARSTEARLIAERDGARAISVPAELKPLLDDPRISASLRLQGQLLHSRQAALHSELASIDENVGGLNAQIAGLEDSRKSKLQQLQFMKEQLDGVRDLAKEGFVARNRLLDLEQNYAQVSAAVAEDLGIIGRSSRQIAELHMKRQQRLQEYEREVRTQLSDVQKEASAMASRLSGQDHSLRNVDVTAPVDGTVIGLSVFSRGAVVPSAFRMMDIVPSDDPLIVEGRLPVHLIDKVAPDLAVDLIFSAFNQNKTPHVSGVVSQVSADRLVDERTGEPYYRVLAKVTPEGMQQIANLKVRAGMPVDLFVKTGERTLMNYLLKPLVDHFRGSMTEE